MKLARSMGDGAGGGEGGEGGGAGGEAEIYKLELRHGWLGR